MSSEIFMTVKLQVGFIGWRGLVGSVLLHRMREENDFNYFIPHFFSTSQVNLLAPDVGQSEKYLKDAYQLDVLATMDIIVTCHGSDYTSEVYPKLRSMGWKGFWLDASSNLRLENDSMIVLDPVNQEHIEEGLTKGIKTFVGGNCTVSLMLLALKGLFAEGLIEWISSMTYQAVSGAGAKAIEELLKQIHYASTSFSLEPMPNILEMETAISHVLQGENIPTHTMGAPLLGNILPWIDVAMANGQSREEWKAMLEANKILQSPVNIPIDGTCVRVGAFRAHSQALTVKLKKNVDLSTIEQLIQSSHPWLKWVPNNREDTIKNLTPLSVSGTLDIAVGRVRKMSLGEKYLNVFTVGDQLLWGAAEPLRRMLRQLTCYS
jgi:aspartate-semialdehyde dehydrogenase